MQISRQSMHITRNCTQTLVYTFNGHHFPLPVICLLGSCFGYRQQARKACAWCKTIKGPMSHRPQQSWL